METNEPSELDSLILGEIQVLLSEKRTALSTMRTGIAVFALPLSVLSVLIATSRNYNIGHVMPLLLPGADPEIPVARGSCRLTQTNVAAFSAVGTSRVREVGNKGTLASRSACPTGLLFNSLARRRR